MNTNVCLNHLEDCSQCSAVQCRRLIPLVDVRLLRLLAWLTDCCSGGLSIIVIAAMTCGIHRLCRREREVLADQPTYSVAISNSLFKEERWVLCWAGQDRARQGERMECCSEAEMRCPASTAGWSRWARWRAMLTSVLSVTELPQARQPGKKVDYLPPVIPYGWGFNVS